MSWLGIILRLVKYKLSLTVAFSALTGYLLTGYQHGYSALIIFSGVFLLASGASALNQFEEKKQDALMERTWNRPLPNGAITSFAVFLISLILIISGLIILGLLGEIPLIMGVLNIILYNFVYTPLKRISSLAIIPGALVGAITPLIGWSAAGLSISHPNALFISGFVFLWQIPHFWLLLLQYSQDYKRAGFAGIFNTLRMSQIRIAVFIWGVITSMFLFTFPLFGLRLYPQIIPFISILNILFIYLFHSMLFRKKSTEALRYAFILINSFAVLVFVALILGRV